VLSPELPFVEDLSVPSQERRKLPSPVLPEQIFLVFYQLSEFLKITVFLCAGAYY